MPQFFVVVNDQAAPPHTGLTHVRTRRTDVGQRTFQYEFDRVAAGLPSTLSDRELDFADLLGVLFAVDVACRRGSNEDWTRDIEVWIPVRDPGHWEPLADRLERCFGAFTFDRLRVHFVLDAAPQDPPRLRRAPHSESSCVALLSGGVDSFVGAATLLGEGQRPLYLSHKNSSAASAALDVVVPALAGLGGPPDTVTFTARRSGGAQGESTLRARSMIFIGLAGLMASALGHQDVWINENGVMAVHLPLTEARAGSFSTRTASPRAIRQWQEFINLALGSSLTVRNLLIDLTKPEVAQRGVELGLGQVLPSTVSCWSIGRNAEHCGRCTPCLIRQISHEWAGVAGNAYESTPMDALPGGPASEVARDNLSHMLQLATDLIDLPDALVKLDYPELLNVTAPQTVADNLAMHRRWAEQCLEVAQRHPYARQQLTP